MQNYVKKIEKENIEDTQELLPFFNSNYITTREDAGEIALFGNREVTLNETSSVNSDNNSETTREIYGEFLLFYNREEYSDAGYSVNSDIPVYIYKNSKPIFENKFKYVDHTLEKFIKKFYNNKSVEKKVNSETSTINNQPDIDIVSSQHDNNSDLFIFIFDTIYKIYTIIPDILHSHYFSFGITVLIGNLIVYFFKPRQNNTNMSNDTNTYENTNTSHSRDPTNMDIDTENTNTYENTNTSHSTDSINMDIDTESISPIKPKPTIPSPYIESDIFQVLLTDLKKAHNESDRYMSNRNFIDRILEKVPKPGHSKRMKIGNLIYKMDNSLYQRAKNKLRPLKINLTNKSKSRLQDLQDTNVIDKYTLLGSLNNYINNPVKVYEHSVGSIANWLFTHYFDHNIWSNTPEQIQTTKKRPDFILSGLYKNKLHPKVLVEIKKHKGDSFNKIIKQIELSGLTAVGNQGEYEGDEEKFDGAAMFHVAIRGLDIAITERYNYKTLLDEYEIPNYSGIIPLTQPVNPTEGIENTELNSILPEM
jgi:hypothetical protein